MPRRTASQNVSTAGGAATATADGGRLGAREGEGLAGACVAEAAGEAEGGDVSGDERPPVAGADGEGVAPPAPHAARTTATVAPARNRVAATFIGPSYPAPVALGDPSRPA